jgi:cystathionine beta-lyase/cystathionine gamma-synthase
VHSTTKYLSGHSDVVGGAVVTSDRELADSVRFYQNAAGAVPSPFDSWLTLRGMKTLPVRMRQHQHNAMQVARFLSAHPAVEEVIYPGLSSHPQHDLAMEQMHGAGGMVTFRLPGGRDQADAFFQQLHVFSYAESLGAVESLACYPTSRARSASSLASRLLCEVTCCAWESEHHDR